MKFFKQMKNYPLETKIFHILFLIGIIAYIIMHCISYDWHVTGYVAYATIFIGAFAGTTGIMKYKTGAWKLMIPDMILFVAIIVHHLYVYPY